MGYFLALFSPETHAVFSASDRSVMGFRERHQIASRRVSRGDQFICYLTGASKWTGLLQVEGTCYRDATNRFVDGDQKDDPFVLRFRVSPVVWLSLEQGLPIKDVGIWNALSFTRTHAIGSSNWTGSVRTSLAPMRDDDGRFLAGELRCKAGT